MPISSPSNMRQAVLGYSTGKAIVVLKLAVKNSSSMNLLLFLRTSKNDVFILILVNLFGGL